MCGAASQFTTALPPGSPWPGTGEGKAGSARRQGMLLPGIELGKKPGAAPTGSERKFLQGVQAESGGLLRPSAVLRGFVARRLGAQLNCCRGCRGARRLDPGSTERASHPGLPALDRAFSLRPLDRAAAEGRASRGAHLPGTLAGLPRPPLRPRRRQAHLLPALPSPEARPGGCRRPGGCHRSRCA